MTASFKLNVSNFQGFIIGSIVPFKGLMTSEGVITKVNGKSIVVGENDNLISSNGYLPSVQYSTLSDEQLVAFESSGVVNEYDEATRSLLKLDTEHLSDAIEHLVTLKLASPEESDKCNTIKGRMGQLTGFAKLNFIKKLFD